MKQFIKPFGLQATRLDKRGQGYGFTIGLVRHRPPEYPASRLHFDLGVGWSLKGISPYQLYLSIPLSKNHSIAKRSLNI